MIKLSNLNLNSIVFQKSNLIVCYFHFFNRQQILLCFFKFFCYRRRYFFYDIVIMFFDIIDVFSHNIIIRNFVIENFFFHFFYSKLYFDLFKKKYTKMIKCFSIFFKISLFEIIIFFIYFVIFSIIISTTIKIFLFQFISFKWNFELKNWIKNLMKHCVVIQLNKLKIIIKKLLKLFE